MDTADKDELEITKHLEDAIRQIQVTIDGDFRTQLERLIPTLNISGYPGLGGPELTTETTLNAQALLTNHTKVRYKGHNGVLLPETYNGLGMRNLLFILLQIVLFYREFRAQPQSHGVYLIFIEEPEAHLHPQMQEVFIRQIGALVEGLNKGHADDPRWPVQFVISTHSSHIANEANFETVRYFLLSAVNAEATVWKTKIKDLRKGLARKDPNDKKFLQQYMTLTRCDLFFADKAILIEGTSERLLLPVMIKKLDETDPKGAKLRSQYISVMEVGGAFAHKFFDLLNFLELQSLIITDLDPVEKNGGRKCSVHKANATSNACIKAWFNGEKCIPTDLISKPSEQLIKGRLRIAYQCPETIDGPCGRTFEDAFILTNAKKFKVPEASPEQQENYAQKKGAESKKSTFALEYAIYDLEWEIPTYIAAGLKWLSAGCVASPIIPAATESLSSCTQVEVKTVIHE